MSQPAAKQGDIIQATDIHIILVPSITGTVPTPTPHPFSGIIDNNLSPNVLIMGQPAATVGSMATNTPPHVPQGGSFQIPPTNKATIMTGSPTVFINGKPAARNGDKSLTCDDVTPTVAKGIVIAKGTVFIG